MSDVSSKIDIIAGVGNINGLTQLSKSRQMENNG
jgi:hypothetical protein